MRHIIRPIRPTAVEIALAETGAEKGDVVMIAETRPISKTKTWTLVKIVEKSRGKVELKDEVTGVESDEKEGE